MNITHGEVHLWCAYDEQIKDAYLLSQYLGMLNEEERQQQSRFHFDKHKHQYLITRALIRSVLTEYEPSIPPERWRFTRNAYGKPHIAEGVCPMPLHFNVSHTQGLIVLAVSLDQELGVDVEYLARGGKTIDIAQSFFSPMEYEELVSLAPEYQNKRFFDLWTLKEAYIKAWGMGLSIPLNHFSFLFSPAGDIHISFVPEREDYPDRWRFWQLAPTQEHKIALALSTDKRDVTLTVRDIVPLDRVSAVDCPIGYQKLCQS